MVKAKKKGSKSYEDMLNYLQGSGRWKRERWIPSKQTSEADKKNNTIAKAEKL